MAASREIWILHLALFPGADHDDLFDGLQTMVEGAMEDREFFCFIA